MTQHRNDGGSIMVNSVDFGESKLLNTERKVLQYVELGKESAKM